MPGDSDSKCQLCTVYISVSVFMHAWVGLHVQDCGELCPDQRMSRVQNNIAVFCAGSKWIHAASVEPARSVRLHAYHC